MTTTTYTSLEVSKLAAVITGGGYKRAASKEAAVARFLKIAEDAGITDAAKLLDAEQYGFDAAHHVLVERKKGGYASIPEVQADASLIEATETVDTLTDKIAAARQAGDFDTAEALGEQRRAAEVDADEKLIAAPAGEIEVGSVVAFNELPDAAWFDVLAVDGFTLTIREHGTDFATQQSDASLVKQVRKAAPAPKIGGGRTRKIAEVKGEPAPAAAKEPKAESKAAMLLRLAQTPEGVTNAKMKELTGWTKLGGFFNAAKKAGLELTRERKDGDTTWHAAPKKGAEA